MLWGRNYAKMNLGDKIQEIYLKVGIIRFEPKIQ